MKPNLQETEEADFNNFMSVLILLGGTAVAAFICCLIIKNCGNACKDLCNAKTLIFRRRQVAVHNVSEPSSVARYPTAIQTIS